MFTPYIVTQIVTQNLAALEHKTVKRVSTLLLLYFLLYQTAIAEISLAQSYLDFQQNRVSHINNLANTIAKCVVRQDTSHPVFHGCYDWHSAVHGYWALLRNHRLQTNVQHLTIVKKGLTEDAMQREFDYVRQNKSFEMPYGRAWFLLLITELEQTTGDTRFQSFADFVAETLHQYLTSRTFRADSDEYRNHPWAYTRLLDYYRYRNRHSEWKSIADNISIESQQNLSLNADRRAVFFSLWSNLVHLLGHTMTPEEMLVWETNHRQDTHLLKPISKYRGPHHLAINFSRAWGFWSLYEKTSQAVYLDAYLTHIDQGLLIHNGYKDNYRSYGHWVPQFGIYAISISDPSIIKQQ